METKTANCMNCEHEKECLEKPPCIMEAYWQGRADAINDCLRIVHDVYFGNEYCVSGYYDGLECNGAECDGCLYAIIQKNIIEQLKEQKNE